MVETFAVPNIRQKHAVLQVIEVFSTLEATGEYFLN